MIGEHSKEEYRYLKAIGAVITRLRERDYDTQKKFADAKGITLSQYQAWEAGMNITPVSTMRLVVHFNISIFEFNDLVKEEYFKKREEPEIEKLNSI
jgi:transcriptional regulator with XRE-family HTH domain